MPVLAALTARPLILRISISMQSPVAYTHTLTVILSNCMLSYCNMNLSCLRNIITGRVTFIEEVEVVTRE